jgi:hypothetical protein
MPKLTQQDEENLIDSAMRRSMLDTEFRALLVKDSLAALSKISSKALPDNYRPQFVDNSGPNRVFILPDPLPVTGELSDAELEEVAGGACGCTNCCCSAGCSAYSAAL